MRGPASAIAALALVCLLTRAVRVGLAGHSVDPVSKITTRDEVLRICTAGGLALELASPWFLYQMAAHGR